MHRLVCTGKSLHRGVFAHSFFTHKKRLLTEELCTQKLLHAEASARESLYTEKLLHTEAFTLRSKKAFTQKLFHRL